MTQAQEFSWFLKLLKNGGLLEHVMVIGSWAEYLYAQCGVLENYEANLRTLDVDFLVKNMRRPTEKADLLTLVADAGCTLDHDALNGAVRIYTPGLLEIEFLIAQKGAATEMLLDTNLGIKSQALQHLSILRDYAISVNFLGLDVTIPEPEAYVLHKMAINHQRKPEKREKDALAIVDIIPYLKQERLIELHSIMTRKEKRHIRKFMLDRKVLLDGI